MAASKSLKDLFKKLNGRINSALDNEVFEKVREVELEAIQTEVYDVYTPKVYIRRGEYGGIGDPYNIEKVGGAAKNGRLIVKNTTEPNDSNPNWTTDKILPELIEYGHSRYVRYRGGHGHD